MDNTPGFEKNGRLIESEIPAFIVNSSDVLRRRSKGYGIWTYRDSCDSVVYNAQFGLDEKGWNFQGEAYVMDDGGNKRAYLPSRSAIVQDFNVQLKKGSQVHVQFSACLLYTSMWERRCASRPPEASAPSRMQSVSWSWERTGWEPAAW